MADFSAGELHTYLPRLWCMLWYFHSQFGGLGCLLAIRFQPQPPVCCVTLTKSFSPLWIFPCLKMAMSESASHGLLLGINNVVCGVECALSTQHML